MSEGKIRVTPLITDIIPIDQAPEGCEKLIQTPNEALGSRFLNATVVIGVSAVCYANLSVTS